MERMWICKGCLGLLLTIVCSIGFAQPNLDDGDMTTETAIRAAIRVWEWDMIGCHDWLTTGISQTAVPDSTKVALLRAIPRELRDGGAESLWKKASAGLRKLIMTAAARNLEQEAVRLEAQAARMRKWQTLIDDAVTSL